MFSRSKSGIDPDVYFNSVFITVRALSDIAKLSAFKIDFFLHYRTYQIRTPCVPLIYSYKMPVLGVRSVFDAAATTEK